MDDITRDVNIHDINQMKYLEYCIKETLRLCPPVPMIARKLSDDLAICKYQSDSNLH